MQRDDFPLDREKCWRPSFQWIVFGILFLTFGLNTMAYSLILFKHTASLNCGDKKDQVREKDLLSTSLIYAFGSSLGTALLVWFLLKRYLQNPMQSLLKAIDVWEMDEKPKPIRIGRTSRELQEVVEHFNHLLTRLSLERQALQVMQEELLRSERLAIAGQWSAGIAHEIGNPLSSIMAYLELSIDPSLDIQERMNFIQKALESSKSIQSIVKNFLDYTRREIGKIDCIDPHQALKRAIELAMIKVKRAGKTLKWTPGPSIQVMADEGGLIQWVLNIVLNAIDAMEKVGYQIEIFEITSNDQWQMIICNQGPAISQEEVLKIFEPFYTTKAVGQGTGLGLWICEQLAEKWGGKMQVMAYKNYSTCFELVLSKCRGKYLNL